jgi:anti-sigma regulatory factor (Ser/Thr protein kinase)
LSVRHARSFVANSLTELGRADVAEMAALAASELATNVVLHARSEFIVRVTAVPDGPVRVSVYDTSPVLPVAQPTSVQSAVGRGLRLVAAVTDNWGVERLDHTAESGAGKEVWFEIGGQGRQPPPSPMDGDYDPTATDLLTGAPVPPDVLIEVQLLNTPLRLFARETSRHRELMREMALIAFIDSGNVAVPRALTALAAELEDYRGVGAATDAARDAAFAAGELTMDLVYQLPPAVGPACSRLNEMLDEADEFCHAQNLLTLAASADGLAVRRWYLDQIATQVSGAQPVPWDGPLD